MLALAAVIGRARGEFRLTHGVDIGHELLLGRLEALRLLGQEIFVLGSHDCGLVVGEVVGGLQKE